jgi:nitrile hydratase
MSHDDEERDSALRVKALESLLIARGVVEARALDEIVDAYQTRIGPRNGARVVARAWIDERYKLRLLASGTAGIAELGFGGMEGEHLAVVENTPTIHNVIVCTLCSCYPWPVLGLPPPWYKSAAYRSRVVREPRTVLAEFGLLLPESTQVRVWDSTAELRYLVLPMRPGNTESFSEEELRALVTRDGMIGTAVV